MKLRKRFLAAVLTLAMLLTCIPFSAVLADEEVAETASAVTLKDIDGNTVVGKAVTELVKLGIINGYEDGTFRADNTITRGEVAKIIVTFLGQESVAFDTVPSGFPDVDSENHWAKKYIKLAADQKIVNGYEDGTFRPNDPVKYTEIVKMLVCTLGYGQIALDRTAEGSMWYAGYMAIAAEKGILKSASVNNVEDYASRGVVAVLTNNSLHVETVETNAAGEIILESGKTALEKFQEKTKVSGVVKAVYQTGLDTVTPGLLHRQIIMEIKGEDTTVEVPVDFDTMSVLGRRISGYLEDGDFGGYDKITQIAVEKTESTIIEPDMIERAETGKLTYYPSETSTRSKSIGVEGVKVIYNGKYDSTFLATDFDDIQSGQIELICNDSDGDAEVAIVTSYENYVVNSVDKSQEQPKVYAKYGAGELIIPLDTRNAVFSLKKDGSTSDAATIAKGLKEWDVISVMKSRDDAPGRLIWNGFVTSKKVSGKITESDSETRKKIGNKMYEYAKSFIAYDGQKPAMEAGDYVTVYLDYEGKIAAASASQTEGNVYVGYLISGEPGKGIDGNARINLYGLTGTTKQRVLNLARNVRVDGNTLTQDEALAALKISATLANTDKAEKDINVTEYAQLIRYSTNANGDVELIDTISENRSVGDDDLTRHTAYPLYPVEEEEEEEVLLKYNAGRFSEGSSLKFIVDSKTKVLEIPYEDVTKIEDYKIRSYSTAFTDSKYYRVEAYNVDATYTADYVISFVGGEFGVASINETSPIMIATELSSKQGTDGVIDKVKGYKFTTADDVTVESETAGLLMNAVDFGDIFRYALSDDSVTSVEKIVDFSTEAKPNKPTIYFIDPRNENPEYRGRDIAAPVTAVDEETAADVADKAMELRFFQLDDANRSKSATIGAFMFGTALSHLNGKLVITPTILEDSAGIQQTHQEIFTISDANIYIYDYTATRDNAKVLRNASADAIATYDKVNDSASQVLVYYSGARKAKAVIIFKY